MIDFSTLQGLTIPEGVVTQITDASGRVLWVLNTGGSDTVILEVEKITADTYVGETAYTAEEFILLDIYPKTNGAVSVTYGGLTKTITDTSGAEKPNAQQVFFGTFNGVADSVTTPTSGELTIEGDYYAFGCGSYSNTSKGAIAHPSCVTAVTSLGKVTEIPSKALGDLLGNLPVQNDLVIPNSVTSIGSSALTAIAFTNVVIGKNVRFIGYSAFTAGSSLKTVKILASVPPEIGSSTNSSGTTVQSPFFGNVIQGEIIVPKGCGNAYKTAAGWSQYADYIVEAE